MSQAEKQSPPQTGDSRVEELRSSAHLMMLETGIYCLVNGSPLPTAGLAGVRVSTIDPTDSNIAITSFRSDGWLSGTGDAALIRVMSGPAQVMITIYQSTSVSDAPPKIRVLRLSETAPTAVTTAPVAAVAGATRRPVMILTEPHDVVAHVQSTGDVGIAFGDWAGRPGSQFAIEGFSLRAPADLAPSDLTYQAVLGRGWLSPWSESGQFCGSRGMALPLLGLKVKLSEAAAKRYTLTYEASFVDGSQIGPVGSEESCETEGLSPLEAMRVTLVPKTTKSAKLENVPVAKAPAPAPVKAVPKVPAAPPKPIAKANPTVAVPAKSKPIPRKR
jgi:hypothetical protein